MATRHALLLATAPCLLLSVTGTAQDIGRDDLLPPIGATWHMRALQAVPALPPDERPMVWPFSTLHGNDVFGASYAMVAPGTLPQGASYPQAERALVKVPDNGGDRIHTFIDVQDDRSLEVASLTPTVSLAYSSGALMAAYPLGFLSPVSASHCFSSVGPDAITPYCGSTEISHIHNGRLELAFGTFPEARLVRMRRSTVNQQATADSTMTETLTWYTPGSPYPLLQFITVHYPDGTQARNGYILDESSVVGMDAPRTSLPLHAFPVPAQEEVFVGAPRGGELLIHAADGRLVHAERLAASATPIRIGLSALREGTYRAVLRTADEIRSTTLIIAH